VTPGGKPTSFDKQFLRNWLLEIEWDQTPPPPPLTDEVVKATATTYAEIQRRLTE
jgi:phosphoribosylaminoimidazole-succinocarboxamide synthase